MSTEDKYAEHRYHGGPFDRGGADSYYRRPNVPHKWPDGTMHGTKVEYKDLTAEEVAAYEAGFEENEQAGDFKDWGGEYPDIDEVDDDVD